MVLFFRKFQRSLSEWQNDVHSRLHMGMDGISIADSILKKNLALRPVSAFLGKTAQEWVFIGRVISGFSIG